MTENIDKKQLLAEFINSLTDNSWSNRNYSAVISATSKNKAEWDSNFPLGLEDLTKFFIEDSLSNVPLPERSKFLEMKTQARLEFILTTYLKQFNNKDIIIKLVTYFKTPELILTSSGSVYLISNKFWNLIEDTSIDFNFYTKRFILMSVITPTILFWTKDDSEDNKDTEQYMKKCFKRSMGLGKIKNKIKSFFSKNTNS